MTQWYIVKQSLTGSALGSCGVADEWVATHSSQLGYEVFVYKNGTATDLGSRDHLQLRVFP